MADQTVTYDDGTKQRLELETVAGWDSELGRVTWGLCEPNAGDTLFDLSTHLSPAEQEQIANIIAAAFAPGRK